MSKYLFIFDCETDGLYGDCFAVGAIAMTKTGKEVSRFSGIAEKETVTNGWVQENVIPQLSGLKEFASRLEMRNAFWDFWMRFQKNSLCIADVGSPVESGFFRKCIEDDLENRQWNGPYPLHEVATMLIAHGIDPDIDRVQLSGVLSKKIAKHNPLDDAYISALCWMRVVEHRGMKKTMDDLILQASITGEKVFFIRDKNGILSETTEETYSEKGSQRTSLSVEREVIYRIASGIVLPSGEVVEPYTISREVGDILHAG